MSRGVAWILFGAVVAGCGIIKNPDGNTPIVGFIIALIATILSYYGKKRD